MRRERAAWAGGTFLALLVLGCGDQKMAEVSGAVKLDGTPIEEGAILFVPVDGKTSTAGGAIKDGRYSVRAPLGAMKVSISAGKVVATKKVYPTPDSPVMPIKVEAVPAKYNEQTELKLEVQSGKNQKDFELQTK